MRVAFVVAAVTVGVRTGVRVYVRAARILLVRRAPDLVVRPLIVSFVHCRQPFRPSECYNI